MGGGKKGKTWRARIQEKKRAYGLKRAKTGKNGLLKEDALPERSVGCWERRQPRGDQPAKTPTWRAKKEKKKSTR